MTTIDDALLDSFKHEDEKQIKELKAKNDKLEAKLRRHPVPKDDGLVELGKLLDCESNIEEVRADVANLITLCETVVDEVGNLNVGEREFDTIIDRVKSLSWCEDALEGLGENIKYADHDELLEQLTEIVESHSKFEGLLDTVKDLHEFITKHVPRGEIRFEDSTVDVLFERLMLAARKAYG